MQEKQSGTESVKKDAENVEEKCHEKDFQTEETKRCKENSLLHLAR